jgi:hypothetical protein
VQVFPPKKNLIQKLQSMRFDDLSTYMSAAMKQAARTEFQELSDTSVKAELPFELEWAQE